MATKRIRMKRRATRRRAKQKRRTRKQHLTSKKLTLLLPPLLSKNNYSPVSSPGTSNSNNSPIKNTNTPITKRAKELARLYPSQRAMLNRSTSFNNSGLSNEEFYERFGKEFGFENKPYFPEDHLTERYR